MSQIRIFIRPSFRCRTASVRVTAPQPIDHTLKLSVVDQDGADVVHRTVLGGGATTVNVELACESLRVWDIDDPYRYTLRVTGGPDGSKTGLQQEVRFGFRDFWIEGRRFFLNGSEVRLRPVLADLNAAPHDLSLVIRNYIACGFNIAEIWPGPTVHPELVDAWCEAADELGFILTGPAGYVWPHMETWRTSKTRAAYRAGLETEIARLGHHPSLVMWGTNGNTFGSSLNMDPRSLGRRRDAWHDVGYWRTRREQIGHDVVAMFHELDPSRPVFMHHGGGIGDVHTLNMYLNLAPLQEREEWLSQWAADGELPLLIVEFGTPLHVSFMRGRTDFGGGIQSEPLLTEYCAIYLGPRAYELESAEYRQEIVDTHVGGQRFRPWHMNPVLDAAPALQELECLFIRNTWRSWRAFGMSGGMIPWNHAHGWVRGPGDGMRGIRPAGRALVDTNGPTLAWIAGGAGGHGADRSDHGSFTAKDHSYRPDQAIRKQAVLLNDTRRDAPWRIEWTATVNGTAVASGQAEGTIPTAGRHRSEIAFVVPAEEWFASARTSPDGGVVGRGAIELGAVVGETVHADRFEFAVVAPDRFKAHVGTARPVPVMDPHGRTLDALNAAGIAADPWEEDTPAVVAHEPGGVLVLGERALGTKGELPPGTAEFVHAGGRLIVLAQERAWLRDHGFRVAEHLTRRAFRVNPQLPLWTGLSDEELSDWAGASTLTEAYPVVPPGDTRLGKWWFPYHGYHWGNRGALSSAAVEKPHRAGWQPLLECEFDLAYSPLLELRYGQGLVTLCTLDLADHAAEDPVAELLLARIVGYAASAAPVVAREVFLVGNEDDASLLESLGVRFTATADHRSIAGGSILAVGSEAPLSDTDLEAAIRAESTILLLPRTSPAGPLGLRLEQRRLENGSLKPPDWPACVGLSASDLRWRAPHNAWCVTSSGGWEPGANGLLGRLDLGSAEAIAFQIDPRRFETQRSPYFRFTRWRAMRAFTQLFANLGATFDADDWVFGARGSRPASLAGEWRILARPQLDASGEVAPTVDAGPWSTLSLPGPWQHQAAEWSDPAHEIIVRRDITIPSSWVGHDLIVSLGKIDDSDHTYWDGHRIDVMEEKGLWPHNMPRVYQVPATVVTSTRAVLAVHISDRANRYDRVWNGGFVGPAEDMWIRVREAGLYADDYRHDYVYGDDPYRYFNW